MIAGRNRPASIAGLDHLGIKGQGTQKGHPHGLGGGPPPGGSNQGIVRAVKHQGRHLEATQRRGA